MPKSEQRTKEQKQLLVECYKESLEAEEELHQENLEWFNSSFIPPEKEEENDSSGA